MASWSDIVSKDFNSFQQQFNRQMKAVLSKLNYSNLGIIGGANQVLGVNSAGTLLEYKTVAGTENEIEITHSTGGITLSVPNASNWDTAYTRSHIHSNLSTLEYINQSLATTAVPTFAGGIIPYIKPASDSTTAFIVKNAAGTSNVFVVDTVNNGIGINSTPKSTNTLDVYGRYVVIGGNNTASPTSRTDNTNKIAVLGCPIYDIDEEEMVIFVANATSTANAMNFGGSSGSHNAVTAINFYTAPITNMTTGMSRGQINGNGVWLLFGNTHIGSSADPSTRFEVTETSTFQCCFHNGTTGAVTSETVDISDAGTNDVTCPPVVGANDVIYFGTEYKFETLEITVGTAGVYTATLVWEYWTGSAWSTLTVTDGTNYFKNAGTNNVTWTAPSNWARTSVVSAASGTYQYKYWVRCRVSAFTSVTTPPLLSYAYINVNDGYSATISSDPTYNGFLKIARHNYYKILAAIASTGATVTDAAIWEFDYAAGTHPALDSAAGAFDAFVKHNEAGTLVYSPILYDKEVFPGDINLASGKVFKINEVQVLGAGETGWVTSSGTAVKDNSGWDADTITATDANVQALGKAIKGIIDALLEHGILTA